MKPIIGRGGKLLGYIRQTPTGKELLSPGGRLLGYYDEKRNQTLRPGGSLHSYGDTLMELLED